MSDAVLVDIGIGKTKVNAFRYSKHVAAVSADAFMDNINLTAIEIPYADAFQDNVFSGCSALQQLTLPAIDYTGIDLFGQNVPADLKKLSFKKNEGKHLKLGNAFSKLSSLDEVDFDGMLAEFNCMSLRDAGSLKKLDLGHVCNVAENALSGLTSLEEVHVPVRNEVHSLGLQQLNVLKKVIVNLANEDTLSSLCPGLLNDVHADEISFEKHGLAIAAIQPGALSGTSVNVIDLSFSKVHEFPAGAFKDDTSLTCVMTGPLQLTSIHDNAFYGCNEVKVSDMYGYSYLKDMHQHGAKQLTLQRMYSNTCLRDVHASAFMHVALEHPALNTPLLVNAEEYAFAHVDNLVSAQYGCRMHVMPAYCYAFNRDLQYVEVQSNVDIIKHNAFECCNKLSCIQLNGTAIRLDDFALHDLSSLKAFDVSKVTYVGKHAMQNCICVDFSYACLRNITHIGEFGLANAIHTVKDGVWYELNEQLFTDVEKNAFAGCEVAGFIMKTSLAELDEALSAKIGQSIIPVSTDPSDIVQKYHVLKDWLGVACDFEMILDDFVLNAKGNGLDYSCFIYNNSRDEIVDLKVNADLQKFIDMPVFPSRAKSIAYNALNVDIFKKSIQSLDLNNVTSVDVGQFCNCRQLTSFSAPCLEHLPECCLCGCIRLHDIKLDKCTSIASTALHRCDSISSASLPAQMLAHNDIMQLSAVAARATAFGDAAPAADVFIEDEHQPGRVKRVNDNNIDSSSQMMPAEFQSGNALTSIGSYSMQTTIKTARLSVGENVKVIEDNAFTDNTSIKEVYWGKSAISTIGKDAFTRSSVSSFHYPHVAAAYYTIQDYGLNKSNSLQRVTFDRTYKQVAPSAFANCQPNLSSVQLPYSLTSIGEYAFADMRAFFPRIADINLQSLDSLKSIGDFAFYNSICTTSTGLDGKKLTIPASVQKIGTAAFGYSVDARTQQISSLYTNAYSIGPSAFMRGHLREVSLGDDVLSIGDFAFANPKYKFTICIPQNVKHIGAGVFKRNIILNPDAIEKNIISADFDSALQLLSAMHASRSDDYTAPNTVSATDDTVFLAIRGDASNNFVYVKNGMLNICPDNLSISILDREVTRCAEDAVSAFIPQYVHTIGPSAFIRCESLTSVSSVNDMLDICESAFYGCGQLSGINLPSSFYLSAAPSYAFYGCSALQNVRILSVASYVGEHAFAGCKTLQRVQDVIAEEKQNFSLPYVGDNAFDGCVNLSSFFIPHDISSFGDDVFNGCSSLSKVEIDLDVAAFLSVIDPSSSKTACDMLSSKFNCIRDDAKCALVFNDAVYMNDGNIKIDDEYVTIAYDGSMSAVQAFNYEMFISSGMTYLNLSNVSEVGQFVFRDTQTLETINFLPGEQSLSYVGDYAFSKCTYLRALNGNSLSVKAVGMYAFAGCSLISKMTFDGDVVSSIGYGAFSKTSLKVLSFTFESPDADKCRQAVVLATGFNEDSNQNPLELPEDCAILLVSKHDGVVFGKYDYMMNDMMYADIDINRNQMVFIDKRHDAIKPLLLVRSTRNHLPAIVDNRFHMNVIGRWK